MCAYNNDTQLQDFPTYETPPIRYEHFCSLDLPHKPCRENSDMRWRAGNVLVYNAQLLSYFFLFIQTLAFNNVLRDRARTRKFGFL